MRLIYALFLAALPTSAFSDATITDGTNPGTCGQMVAGLTCTGSYCDNIEVACKSISSRIGAPFYSLWRGPISDGRSNSVLCEMTDRDDLPRGTVFPGFISGFHCTGHNCDNVAVECNIFLGHVPDPTTCRTVGPVSEEDSGTIAFPRNFAATRMTCDGDFCDNKTFEICEIVEARR